jgi:hypothetical protein
MIGTRVLWHLLCKLCAVHRDVVMMDDLRPGSVVQRTPCNAETGEGYSADIAFTTDGSTLHLALFAVGCFVALCTDV